MALTKIGTLGIADDAITSALLPANSVDSSEITAGAVDLAHMSVSYTHLTLPTTPYV